MELYQVQLNEFNYLTKFVVFIRLPKVELEHRVGWKPERINTIKIKF